MKSDLWSCIQIILEVYVILIGILIVLSLLYLILKFTRWARNVIDKVKTKRAWKHIKTEGMGYAVFCMGRRVDMSKVNIYGLDIKQWRCRCDRKSKEIYLNPLIVSILASEDMVEKGLKILPAADDIVIDL